MAKETIHTKRHASAKKHLTQPKTRQGDTISLSLPLQFKFEQDDETVSVLIDGSGMISKGLDAETVETIIREIALNFSSVAETEYGFPEVEFSESDAGSGYLHYDVAGNEPKAVAKRKLKMVASQFVPGQSAGYSRN